MREMKRQQPCPDCADEWQVATSLTASLWLLLVIRRQVGENVKGLTHGVTDTLSARVHSALAWLKIEPAACIIKEK